MRFIKENPALVIGVFAPILIIAIFSLSILLPNYFVAAPHYSCLYTIGEMGASRVQFDIVNGKISAQQDFSNQQPNYYINTPKLYLYNAKTNKVREIGLPLVHSLPEGTERKINIALPELQNVVIDPNITSPDGYKLENKTYRNTGFFPFEYYNASSYSVLRKDGRSIKLSYTDALSWGYQDVRFLGWIVEGTIQ
jgi:alpha-N-acetylglucosamine transferase